MTESERVRFESIAARLRAANPPEHPDPGWESRRKLPPHFAGAAEVLDYLSACRAMDDAEAGLKRFLGPAGAFGQLFRWPPGGLSWGEPEEARRLRAENAVRDWPAREDLAPAVARLLDARAALLAAWDAVPDGLRAGLRGPARLR